MRYISLRTYEYRTQPLLRLSDVVADDEDDNERRLVAKAVQTSVNKLPEPQARVMRLWLMGCTQDYIAKREGITQAAVSIRAKKAMLQLKFDLLPLVIR